MKKGTRAKKKVKTAKKKGKRNTGVTLEKTVARIQQMMDPNSKVTHNEKLVDRLGNTRQYDVVIRGSFGGRDVLGVIECKDHNRKKGPSAVDAFANNTDNLIVNFRLMVARKGFTDQALKIAAHKGIGCLSLLPSDPKQVGFGIGETWYGRLYEWGESFLTIYPEDEASELPDHFATNTVKWKGQPVIDWFSREFFTTFNLRKETGDYTLAVSFDTSINIEVEGGEFRVKTLSCTAKRNCTIKKKFVTWSGDAFYDWQSRKFTIPPKGILVGSAIDTTLGDWDDFDGDIPEPGEGVSFVRMTFDCFKACKIPEDEVPNLNSVITSRGAFFKEA